MNNYACWYLKSTTAHTSLTKYKGVFNIGTYCDDWHEPKFILWDRTENDDNVQKIITTLNNYS